jgi:anti-sigma-K factor RskA
LNRRGFEIYRRNFVQAAVFNSKDTMKNEPLQNQLRELAWRRKLTGAERAELRAQPEAQADLELESRLSDALARVPDAPVPSNFTARVLQSIEREEARGARTQSGSWYWRVLVPRIAVAVAVVAFAGLAYQHHESDKRAQLARDVALLARAQSLPSVEALKNFDAIQRMSQTTTRADVELLALLK